MSSNMADDNSLVWLAIRKFNLKKDFFIDITFFKMLVFLICEQISNIFSVASIFSGLTKNFYLLILTLSKASLKMVSLLPSWNDIP